MRAVSTTVSLKAAQVASKAVASMAALQSGFPEIHAPMALGAKILNGMVVSASAKPQRMNGHARPSPRLVKVARVRPVRLVAAPTPKKVLVYEERTAWEPSSPQEASRCRALLLEVLRRAAHDWVLYRQSSRLNNKECAQDAYIWLFEESKDHPAGRHRASAIFEFDDGDIAGVRNITSFLGICEALDLDPDTVRSRVRQMDVQTIISAGRPAETRRMKRNEASGVEEAGLSISVNIDPNNHRYDTQYESYGSVATPEMLSLNDISGIY